MGAFEDFVNANLGIRKPLIFDFAPPTGADKSLKAAGIRGAHFLDLSTNFLYEKTGENNNVDWVKIAQLGDPRGGGGGAGVDTNIQFISGDQSAGSEHLIYNYESNQLSGASGHFDYFTAGDAIFSNDVHISGDLHISGKTYVNEVLDYSVTGTISGYTGIYHYLKSDYITGNTGHFFDEVIVGDAGDDDGIILDGGNIIAGGNFEMSGELVVSGRNITQGIDDISGFAKSGIDELRDGLSGVSGFSESGISGLNDDLLYISGESLANFIALGDDISIVEDNLVLVSGESTANSIALSEDISNSLPSLLSIEIPEGITTTGMLFSDLNNITYSDPPHVFSSVRLSDPLNNPYYVNLYNLTDTGFFVKFSNSIAESGNFLDLAIYR